MRNARMGWGARLLALAFAVSLGSAAHPEGKASAEQNRGRQIEQASARIADAIRNVRPEEDKGCEGTEDNPTSNICAQWEAVHAARAAAYSSWGAVFLSFVGTFLIFLTFLEQKRTSRAELRAYISVGGFPAIVVIDETGRFGGFRFQALAQNTGSTPARIKYGIVDVRETGPKDVMPEHEVLFGIGAPLGVSLGGESSGPVGAQLFSLDVLRAIFERRTQIFLYVGIQYEDIFKKTHITRHTARLLVHPDLRRIQQTPGDWRIWQNIDPDMIGFEFQTIMGSGHFD